MAKSAFGSIAKPKAAAKAKDEKYSFTDTTLTTAVEQWVRAKSTLTQAEQDMAEPEAEILPRTEDERIKASLQAGSNQTTVILNDKLSISQSKRYKTVSPEVVSDLQASFGTDADRYFRTKMAIKVKESIIADEAAVAELAAAVGEENLGKFFDVTETIEVSEAFHTERATVPALADKAKEAMAKGLVSPYKASIRLK